MFQITTADGRAARLPAPEPGPDGAGGFAFGMYKAGSTMMHAALRRLCRAGRVPFYNLPVEARQNGGVAIERTPLAEGSQPALDALFAVPGVVFGGFREFPDSFEIDLGGRPIAWLIRDPRDMLTSQYFSLKFSHPVGQAFSAVEKARERLAEVAIDDFVLQNAKNAQRWFSHYERKLAGHPVVLRRYEDIIFDKTPAFRTWCDLLGIPVTDRQLDAVMREIDVRPDREDVGKHIRRVVPGDHKQKLQPGTIEQLNAILRPVLAKYGYDAA